jgi:hypothetical protein
MAPQLVTVEDRENYGDALIDLTRRAAVDAVSPALNALRQENQHLQRMAARAQNANIQQELDRALPGWQQTYQDPRFSEWLAQPDDYSGAVRTQLLRDAVAKGDAGRVVAIYRGFVQEAGQHVPAAQQHASHSRQSATGGPRIYSRDDIRRLYEQRRLGQIDDATWAKWEPAIIQAANDGRIAGALNLRDGTQMSMLR